MVNAGSPAQPNGLARATDLGTKSGECLQNGSIRLGTFTSRTEKCSRTFTPTQRKSRTRRRIPPVLSDPCTDEGEDDFDCGDHIEPLLLRATLPRATVHQT